MKRNEFLKVLDRLSMWSSHGRRAPHKPLPLLLALGRVVRGRDRLARYQDLEKPLIGLLKRFGPPRKAHHPEFPFGRLRNDGEGRLWEIPKDDLLSTTRRNCLGWRLHTSSGTLPVARTSFRTDWRYA